MSKQFSLVLSVFVLSFLGFQALAADLKSYSTYPTLGTVSARDTANNIAVPSPAAGQIIVSGSPLVNQWTVNVGTSAYDRIVNLTGNTLRPGVFYQLPFTGPEPKGGGTVQATITDALIDQLVAAFVHVDGTPDIDPVAVSKSFIVEVRAEVTSDHTLTGVPQYAAAIGDSGAFTLQKSVSSAITGSVLGSVPQGVAVGQAVTLSVTATVTPAATIPVATVTWGDGTTSPATVVSVGNGVWSFTATHVWTVASAGYYGNFSIAAGNAAASVTFMIPILPPPPVSLPLYLSDIVASNLQVLVNAGWTIKVSGGDGITKPGKVIAKSADGSQMLTFQSTPQKKKK